MCEILLPSRWHCRVTQERSSVLLFFVACLLVNNIRPKDVDCIISYGFCPFTETPVCEERSQMKNCMTRGQTVM
jgi:hypothetical protein